MEQKNVKFVLEDMESIKSMEQESEDSESSEDSGNNHDSGRSHNSFKSSSDASRTNKVQFKQPTPGPNKNDSVNDDDANSFSNLEIKEPEHLDFNHENLRDRA